MKLAKGSFHKFHMNFSIYFCSPHLSPISRLTHNSPPPPPPPSSISDYEASQDPTHNFKTVHPPQSDSSVMRAGKQYHIFSVGLYT